MATTPRQTTRQTTKKKQPPTSIRRIGGDLYWVSSASHPGTGHHVTPQSCTCPASRYGRPDCRHRALVRMYHAWRTQQAAQAQDGAPRPPAAEVLRQVTAPRPLSSYFE